MDIKRDPAVLKRKRIRRAVFAGLGIVVLIVITVAVSRLKPAAPSVPASVPWYGTVKRGDFVRNVRGAGTLVPEEIRWIPATTSGRVDRIILRPGAHVTPGTVILELSNPDLQQQVANAELSWKAQLAQLATGKANLQKDRLSQQTNVSDAQSDVNVATSQLEARQQLAKEGLVSDLEIRQLQATLDKAKNRLELARQQLKIAEQNEEATLAPQEAQVNQAKAQFDQLTRQVGDLKVKSNMTGVLQVVQVEVGQQVGPGAPLVRVADPTDLKAEVRITETQTKDLAIGLPAEIDTRNGIVKGHVSRIDPASNQGTVGVDVILDGPLPPGARMDLSVDGVIELESLHDVLYVDRPAFGQDNSAVSLFKVSPDGSEAYRVQVKFGRAAVSVVEVLEGLQEGDKVILSDMSPYDAYDRVRLN